MTSGWECPKYWRVWGPYVTECSVCNNQLVGAAATDGAVTMKDMVLVRKDDLFWLWVMAHGSATIIRLDGVNQIVYDRLKKALEKP
jgi:hypothetical protein